MKQVEIIERRAALALSGSVGAWAALEAACLLALWARRGGRGGRGGLGWVLLPAAALALLALTRGRGLWNPAALADDLEGRLRVWKAAWSVFTRHPWLGTGFGLTQPALRLAEARASLGFGAFAHDLALHWLMAAGLAGCLGGLAWLALVAARLARREWSGGDLALLAGLAASLIHSLWDIDSNMPEIWLAQLFLLGCLLGPRAAPAAADAPQEAAAPAPGPGRFRFHRAWAWAALLPLSQFYRGGLMPWQGAFGLVVLAALLAVFLRKGGELAPADALERLGLIGLAYLFADSLLGIEVAPGFETLAFLSGAWIFWVMLRRCAPESRDGSGGPEALFTALQAGAAALVLAALVLGARQLRAFRLPSGAAFYGFMRDAVHPVFPNQNLLAGLLCPLLFAALAFLLQRRRAAWNAALVALFGLAFVLTGSKGGLLACLGGLAWLAWRLPRRPGLPWWMGPRAVLAGLSLLALAALLVPGSGLRQRYLALVEGRRGPNLYDNLRPLFWEKSWDLMKRRPLTGFGPGTYARAFEREDLALPLAPANPVSRYRLKNEYAHQEWLQLGVEGGVAAWLLAAGFLLLLAGEAWRHPPQTPLEAALEAGLVSLGLQSMVDFDLHNPALLLTACVLLALRFPLRRGGGRSFAGPLAWVLALGWFAFCLGPAWGRVVQGRLDRLSQAGPADPRRASLALQGMALRPRRAAFLLERARPLFRMAFRDRDPSALMESLRDFDRATALAPDWGQTHFLYGSALESASGLGQDELLERAGRQDARWLELGRAHPDLGPGRKLFLLALEEARLAVEAGPYNAPWRLNLALVLLRAGRVAEAGEALDQTLNLEPNDAQAWEWKARLALKGHDKPALRQALVRLLEIHQLHPVQGDPYETSLLQADWPWIEAEARKLGLSFPATSG